MRGPVLRAGAIRDISTIRDRFFRAQQPLNLSAEALNPDDAIPNAQSNLQLDQRPASSKKVQT
jgi:hypothetical protein